MNGSIQHGLYLAEAELRARQSQTEREEPGRPADRIDAEPASRRRKRRAQQDGTA